jgi:hypothetical protein
MQVTQILLVVVLEISQQMHQSNFMGNLAGNQAINAYNSNFFGYNSGNASGANSSNFFGYYAAQSIRIGQILQISLVCRWS